MRKLELVSPAGNFDQLKAAINGGADAVYLAYTRYGARAYAKNFSLEELEEATSYASKNNVKCYLTLNTLIKDKELEDTFEFLKHYFSFNQDGIIIQDFGILKLLKDRFPSVPIHASTQLNIHNNSSVKLLEEMGFKRIVLAREMTLGEINSVSMHNNVEIEVFGHGSQCYSYSGLCYFSSFIGSRSGNRGRCSQPCRMKYHFPERMAEKRFFLSKNDICTLDILPEIINSEITALKIEGRMKTPQYTAITTSIYRKYIDRYYQDPNAYSVDSIDIFRLKQVFSRDLCTGYFKESFPDNIISLKKSGSVGNFMGKISSIEFDEKKRIIKNIYIKSKWSINKKDILEVWTKKGNERIEIIDFERKFLKNEKFLYKIPLGIKSSISLNDRVFKYYDKAIDDFSRSFYAYKLKGTNNGNIFSLEKKEIIKDVYSYEQGFENSSLVLLIHEKEFLKKILDETREDLVYSGYGDLLDSKNVGFFENVNWHLNKIKKRLIIKLPSIIYDHDLEKIPPLLNRMLEIGVSHYYVSNIGVARLLSKFKDINLILGADLNIFNSLALGYLSDFLNKKNIVGVELSAELNLDELNALISRYYSNNDKKLNFLLYAYGYYPLTIARVRKDSLAKAKRKKSFDSLVDEKGYSFYLGNDYNENTILFNSRKTCLLFDLEHIIKKGISNILIDSNFIAPLDYIEVSSSFRKGLQLLHDKDLDGYGRYLNSLRRNELFQDYTKGHLNKGVI
jgi:collagenase-like PrtC family protease